MDKRRLVTVAVALLVGLHAVAGPVAAQTSTSVSRATLADESSVTRTLTYEFTPGSSETTASVRSGWSSSGVQFSFEGWRDLDDGDTGASTSWNVSDGNEYRVTYEATIPSDTAAGTYGGYTADGGAEREYLQVQVTEPQFGNIYTQDATVVFKSNDQGTATKEVSISNTGDGLMMPTEVTFSGVPSGFSVDYDNLPSNVDAGGSGSFDLDIEADSSVSKGTYQFQATVHDNLGNTESFDVSVTVEKPPVLGLGGGGSEVDVGDILVGGQKTEEFTVSEEGGYTGIDGVSSRLTDSDQYGSISFDQLRYLDTSPGGSGTAEVTISVGDDAPQHTDLEWSAYLEPSGENSVGKEIDFTGRVIYPARFGGLTMSNTSMVFDEPKSETDTQTKTVTVTVPNDGDLRMNVLDVTARTDSTAVTASVVDEPDTIGGLSDGEVRVRIEADPDTPEGRHGLSVTVDAEDAGSETIHREIDITHGIELSVENTGLSYGDVIVTKNLTESTDVAEALEYRDVTGLSVAKQSGPDKWLTVVERPPATLTAGEAAPFVVALRFDTSAELYREYTWTYRVTGDDVEAKTVTVTATPKPYSFDQIRDPLSEHTGSGDWRGETASGMVAALDGLESRLRNGGNVSRTDLSTSIAAGRATMLFIESVENASETMDDEGNEAAQPQVVRAAATYNLLDSYVSKLDDPQLRDSAGESRAAAEETVERLVAEQTDYYRSRLDSDDVSMIDRAHIKRQLAQLAALRGETERAERLRTESATAFDAYSETVKEGNRKRQSARRLREEMREEMLTVVAGQPLMVNPMNWDAFERQSAAVGATYGEAATAFGEAGATEEAQRVRSERRRAVGSLQVARYSMYGSTAAYGLGFVGLLVYLGRNTYAYVRDAREAVSGDFLVAS